MCNCTICKPDGGPCLCSGPFMTLCGRKMQEGTPKKDKNGRPVKRTPVIYTYQVERVGCPECLKRIQNERCLSAL